jgi:hypothetical protein
VEITHLEVVDKRRASLDIALVNANVNLRVDKGVQDRHVRVPKGIKNHRLAPREMIDGGELSQTKAAEWRKGVPLIAKSRRR